MSTKLMVYPDGEFGIKSSEIIFRGTQQQVKEAAMALGIRGSEFEDGAFNLEANDLNVSYFGINGFYLYSERQL